MGQVLLKRPAPFGDGFGHKVLAKLLAREAHTLHLVSVATAQATVQALKVGIAAGDKCRGLVKRPGLDHLNGVELRGRVGNEASVVVMMTVIFKGCEPLYKCLTTYLELPSWITLASVTSKTSLSGTMRVRKLRTLSCSWRVSIDEPFGDRPTGLVSATHINSCDQNSSECVLLKNVHEMLILGTEEHFIYFIFIHLSETSI